MRLLSKCFVTIVPGLFVFLGIALPDLSHAQGISVGNSDLRPELGIRYYGSDNAFRASEAEGAVESSGFLLSPSLTLSGEVKNHEFELGYSGTFQRADEARTDYDDHSLTANLNTIFSRRSRLETNARITFGHNNLGTQFTRFNADLFDQTEFADSSLELRHRFGAAGARLNFVSEFDLLNRNYRNNETLTDGQGYTRSRLAFSISSRLGGNSRGFLRLGIGQLRFEAAELDYDQLNTALGVSWNVTGKSGGSASVGFGQALASSASRNDTDTVTVNVNAWLEPSSLSRFDLALERDFYNDEGGADNADRSTIDQLTLGWRYTPSQIISHRASLRVRRIDGNCPIATEVTPSFTYQLAISIRRAIAVGVGGTAEQSRSDACDGFILPNNPDFDVRRYFLFLRLSL